MPADEHPQQLKLTPNTDTTEGDVHCPDNVQVAGPRNEEHPLDTACDRTGKLENTATAAYANDHVPWAGASARLFHDKERAPAGILDQSEANGQPSLPAQPEKQPSAVVAQVQESVTSVNIGKEPAIMMPPFTSEDQIRTDGTPNFFDWKEVFPELKALAQGLPEILAECTKVSNWKTWPEKHYEEGGEQDWKVTPVFMEACEACFASCSLNIS